MQGRERKREMQEKRTNPLLVPTPLDEIRYALQGALPPLRLPPEKLLPIVWDPLPSSVPIPPIELLIPPATPIDLLSCPCLCMIPNPKPLGGLASALRMICSGTRGLPGEPISPLCARTGEVKDGIAGERDEWRALFGWEGV